MKKLIRKILKEETEVDQKEIIQDMLDDFGFQNTLKYLGGIDNFLDIMYDGDLIKFSEETKTPIAYLSVDGMRFYIHEALVALLKLDDTNFYNRKEKELGDFRFGSKNGFQYKFHARLQPTTLHDKTYYKVVGMSGDSGFGYGFLTKKETLGKRYRQQIFNQIIDKYDLKPYMNVKTFY